MTDSLDGQGRTYERYTNSNESISSQGSININSIIGDWSGIVDIGIAQMTIILHVEKNFNDVLSGTFDYLQEKIYGLPLDFIDFNGKSLKFQINQFSIQFEGNLINSESVISGTWTQYGQLYPLCFERGVKSIEGPNRPQEPKPPYPYREEYVTYDNPAAKVTLSGTLTLPPSGGPFPAVLLIAGAGPSDRDATILGHRPFWVLADYLTRQGIAVLRVDKRGCGKSTGNYNTATTEDFAHDVHAGIEFLKSRKELNSKQFGLIGHSEGGIIAPMVATKSMDVSYIVLMAGVGVTGEELLHEQSASIERVNGGSEETIGQHRSHNEEMFAVLKSESDFHIAARKLREIIANHKFSGQEKQEEGSDAINLSFNTPF